jgi:Spy/CpxP family protein refolding chaperone
MKRTLIAAAAAAALLATPGWAQVGPGMGPGMMGGYGPGGYGTGPGMMGPGMMGGYGPGGYGMGPGIAGPGMMGPGMMGPGMMGGFGPGTGPGMMGRYGGYGGLDLTDEQRAKIGEIQQEVSRKQWDLMAKMHEQGYQIQGLDESGKSDDTAARKAYEAMAAAHKQTFETMLDARKRIDAVLTKEQREQLRRGWRGR